MLLQNRGSQSNSGFTIVELAIVIVVIAILATIMLVSYTRVQDQSKAEDAKVNAGSVKKVAEAYFNQHNVYPTQVTHFSSTHVTMPTDIVIMTAGLPNTTNGKDSILYKHVGGGTGACVMYWDYAPLSGSPRVVTSALLGTATNANCSTTTGTYPT